MSVTFRKAERRDAAAIVDFQISMALETEELSLDRDTCTRGVEAIFDRPGLGTYYIAVDGVRVAGSLLITCEWSDWRNRTVWWIQSVYVDPVWRRQSVFRRMHETVMATAKTSPNVCGVRLYVEKYNDVAQVVYRKVGLTPSSYAILETDFVLARTKV